MITEDDAENCATLNKNKIVKQSPSEEEENSDIEDIEDKVK
jgi:hypothetical protein